MHQEIIKKSVFDTILRFLNRKFKPARKYYAASNADILRQILRVLRYGVPWRDTGSATYSWQTVYARFCNWRECKAFVKIWKKVVKKYAKERLAADGKHFQELFIDSTKILNIGGQDFVGKNSTDRGRLGTKVSIVCDREQVILGGVITKANVSDISLVHPTLDSMQYDVVGKSKYVTYLIQSVHSKLKPPILVCESYIFLLFFRFHIWCVSRTLYLTYLVY